MKNKQAYVPGVIIAGAAAGLLSGIPFVNLVNCCFCAWMIGGGVLAVNLVSKKTPDVIEAGEGAIIGALAGVICGVIAGSIGAVFQFIGVGTSPMANIPGQQNPMAELATNAAAMAAVTLCFSILIYPIFGAVGGLIGAAVFKKKEPPVPPTGFAGPGAPGGAAGPQGGWGPPPGSPPAGGGWGNP